MHKMVSLPLDVFKYIIKDYRTVLAFRCTCRDATTATAAVKVTARIGYILDPHPRSGQPNYGDLRIDHLTTVTFDRKVLGVDFYFGDQYAASHMYAYPYEDVINTFAKLAALADYDLVAFSGTPVCGGKKEYLESVKCAVIRDGIVYLPPRVVVEYYREWYE